MAYDPVPGMRVVCILKPDRMAWEGCDERDIELLNSIQIGAVYTIREVLVVQRHICVRLEEIVAEPRLTWLGMFELAWDANCFRPLDERRLDVFREALKRAPAPHVKEDA